MHPGSWGTVAPQGTQRRGVCHHLVEHCKQAVKGLVGIWAATLQPHRTGHYFRLGVFLLQRFWTAALCNAAAAQLGGLGARGTLGQIPTVPPAPLPSRAARSPGVLALMF